MKSAEQILNAELGAYLKLREPDLPGRIIKCMNEYADQFRKPEKKTIEERILKFRKDLDDVIGHPYCYKQMTIDFYEYWTEHGPTDKKMRFEKEKSFDIKKRLERWAKNQKTFSNGKLTKQTRIENFEQGFREQFAGKDLSVDDGF